MIYITEPIGRRPPSSDIEGEINGADPEYLEISDDNFAAPDGGSLGDRRFGVVITLC
jgi:hypothetical protein